jgi:hydrogenase expression/formation protein HypE
VKSRLPDIGKISPEVFEELIYPRLGAGRPGILVPPQSGVDVGIVEIGGLAVAVTTDPVFIVPEFGFERAAWFAIHILISDLVTCGLPPAYLSIDLNLPMSMTEGQLESVWKVIHAECEKYGIAIVCGHTARYENCHYPMVGGATVFGVGPKDSYVSPSLAEPGDRIVITKGPAIEAAGIFAALFPDRIRREYGTVFLESSDSLFYRMSVVEDAKAAISVGVRGNGVTAMHDATECGILGGVFEIAKAAGLGVILDKDAVVAEPCVFEICRMFGIDDPFSAISEGTLILTCKPHASDAILAALGARGIPASVAGELVPERSGLLLLEGGRERPLEHPGVDPFWKALSLATAKRRTESGEGS